ncbi:head-tail joining protein, partial [Escherichia coli]
KRVFLVILFTSFSGSLVSRIPGAVHGDTLTINGETFWVDRVSPDDGGSCYLWLNRGQPPSVNRRR